MAQLHWSSRFSVSTQGGIFSTTSESLVASEVLTLQDWYGKHSQRGYPTRKWFQLIFQRFLRRYISSACFLTAWNCILDPGHNFDVTQAVHRHLVNTFSLAQYTSELSAFSVSHTDWCAIELYPMTLTFYQISHSFRLRNDLYCVGWGVELYSLTHPATGRRQSSWAYVTLRYVTNFLRMTHRHCPQKQSLVWKMHFSETPVANH